MERGQRSIPTVSIMRALLELVEQGVGIHCFPQNQLSADGYVSGLEDESEIARRNNMHNEVIADVFLACRWSAIGRLTQPTGVIF